MATRAVVSLPASVAAGVAFEVRATVAHPMDTGYRNDDTGAPLPRNLVRRFECHLEGDLVMAADLFAAVSANPYLAFWMSASRGGELRFVWRGDGGFEHQEVRRLVVT